MPDYSKGKIYKITSAQTDKVYIGSTTTKLIKRFSQHKNILSKCSSKELFQYDDTKIELIEDFPCNSGRQLTEREIYHINNTANCINKVVSLAPCNEYLIYEDDVQFIILSQHEESFKVIKKSTPNDAPPDNIIITTPKSILSSIREWNYDIQRKKKKYYEQKEKRQQNAIELSTNVAVDYVV
jgi:hypothetical protein